MEWIINPDLTEEDIKQIYKDPDKNANNNWGYCDSTKDAFRKKDVSILFKEYDDDSAYINWLKEQKIIIPKETECEECKRLEAWYVGINDGMDVQRPICDECAKDLPSLNATSATEAAKSYSHIDKLNNDPGYLRLKIRELEEEVKRLKSEHSDMQNRLEVSSEELKSWEQRESTWKHDEKQLNQESNKWYIKYKELDTKLGALQDVLNGIRIIIGG